MSIEVLLAVIKIMNRGLSIGIAGVVAICFSTKAAIGDDLKVDRDSKNQKTTQAPIACYEPAVLELEDGIGCRVLSKPFARVPGPPVVFATNKDGKTRINPQEPMFPKSKSLKGLSYLDAVQLFGDPESKKDDVVTFCLMPVTGTLEYRQKHMLLLDAKFYQGELDSCRLRDKESGSRPWTKVQ